MQCHARVLSLLATTELQRHSLSLKTRKLSEAFSMRSKNIFITGCGPNGIGAALAKEFHRHGHRVFASGRSEEEIDPSLKELGIKTITLDVTSTASIDGAVLAVRAATGGVLDILINNAGTLHVMPFADTPVEEVRRVFDVNVFAVWEVTQPFLPLLLEAKGMVANLGSINAGFCPPFFAAYSASKAAVEAMGRSMRRELAPLGVRVVTIKTGSVRSSLFDNAQAIIIPDDSIYASLRGWVAERGYLKGANFMELDEYAKVVVGDLLKDNVKPVIWRGGLATLAWVLSWLGWESMMVTSS